MSGTNDREITLSPKLVALLRISKRYPPEKVLDIQAVRVALADLYHPHLPFRDVVRLMLSALEELSLEPRFEILKSPDWRTDLILAPVDKNWFYDRPGSVFTMEEFYQRIVSEGWEALRLSRVDWCQEVLWPDASSKGP